MTQRTVLPNATATLVLGILSIITCWCYGILGIILGVVALFISNNSVKLHKENPEAYDGWQNLNIGRICAMIGIGLGALYLILVIIVGVSLGPEIMQEMQNQQQN